MINCIVPGDFTQGSLEMLSALGEIENDEALRLDIIIKILQRKWQNHAQKFYLLQFAFFTLLLISMIVFFSSNEYHIVLGSGIFFGVFAIYFLLYELTQLIIQK